MNTSKLAVYGGKPVRKAMLPYGMHLMGKEEITSALACLKSNWIVSGPIVSKFEKAFSEYTGAKYAVALTSGTAALHAALLACGIGSNDEVITTPYTFCSTSNAILYAGAKPVFIDVEYDTFNINSNNIKYKINRKTKAILPVHFAGQPCDMDKIMDIAKKHKLMVIEDAAHACGAGFKGKKIGNIGDASCFSFHPVKNMTTVEGGMLTTNNKKIAEKAHSLRFHGITKDVLSREFTSKPWFYEMKDLGFKYNLSDLQASIGLEQLKKLEKWNKIREKYVEIYKEAFKNIKEIEIPEVKEDRKSAWHLYVIKLNLESLKADRDTIMRALRAENIGVNVHYIPVHYHPYYKKRFNFKKGSFPAAERIYERAVTLPLFHSMAPKDLKDVIVALKKVINYYKRSY